MAYRIEEFQTGSGGDEGYNTEYALVDPEGKRVADVQAFKDDYGNVVDYFIDAGGEGYSNIVPVDLNAINARVEQGTVPFGTGMGPALGYPYSMKNAYGDEFRRFDAQGNLTEFLDKDLKFQPASSFKPTELIFNPDLGNFETAYRSPDSPRLNITESTATTVNPYKEDQGGFLGEGGWERMAQLALTGLSAGLAGPALGAIGSATGMGAVGSGAVYGGLTGALGGAIGGGAQGALKGGLLGAAGGAAGGYLSGGSGGAEAFPVEPPRSDFTGMSYGDLSSLGVGEFQPFVGGDVGLGSGMITQFNPDGTFGNVGAVAADTIPEFGDVPTYDFNAPAGEIAPEFDPNARILTAQEAENLMRYNILPADMQTPAVYDWLETPKNLLSGEYGGLIKGGLTLGALAAANALKPQQETQAADGSLTAAQLQALVDAMPSMIGQYSEQAQQAGAGSMNQGYTPAVSQAIAQLFPTFSLPTQGPFYGAGRFGEGYAPNAPIIQT